MNSRTRTARRSPSPAPDPGAAHPWGLFSRADVRRLGLSDEALRWRVRTGAWVRLRHDTYVTAERFAAVRSEPRHLHLLHAAAALQRSAADDVVLSHRSAAIAHGLVLLHPWPAEPEVTLPRHRRSTLSAIMQHTVHTPLPAADVVLVGGLRVTSPLRTVMDVASTTTRHEAVVLLDSALRSAATTPAELDRAAGTGPGGQRRCRLESLVALADARSPDPLTSLARLALLDHRVPLDDVGVMIGRTTQGDALRIPLLWNQARIAVVPRNDARLRQLVRTVGMTPITVDLDDVIHRGTEFAAVIDSLISRARAA